MMKFSRIVCAVAVCACISFAYGKAIKILSIDAAGAGVTENPNADGTVILNYNKGQNRTEIQISLTDFVPGTEYVAQVVAIGDVNAIISTNAAGNGQEHTIAAGDITQDGNACASITVFIDANGNFFAEDDEIRAVGTSCP